MASLNSAAANRAFDAWEISRCDPPEEDYEYFGGEVKVFKNKKLIWSTSGSGAEDAGLPQAMELAAQAWFRTKRGAHLLRAYKEIHGPFTFRNYYESTYGSSYGWQHRIYDPEDYSRESYIFTRTEDQESDLCIKALEWVVSMGMIKVNRYGYDTPGGYWRETVSIGGIKVQSNGWPEDAPEPDGAPDWY
jgi:hypothetical protein